jgi:hypothetical protein
LPSAQRNLEIDRREVSQEPAHQAQHLVVLGCEVFEAVSDRHPGRPERDERGIDGTELLVLRLRSCPLTELDR